MLEIKNLTKVYRSKTGDEVRALDNVSISFPESGMIFILGKSGSGKSTLLNVMGGLDSYDEGEFIIKGKSSKDFGGSDFDAYRNTFIGFIFQEYNVLDDFTVGANIGLALELQGKKATTEKINEILGQVDLLNYAKRKPNELSGGQKQRVAIARALVKEPQIIMADEPTGALDSNTGKQIFDTLKALSREKLVLIVSHDRDFAERYADRIIELSDGRIISDVTKHEHQSEALSEGVDRINHNIFRIKGGYRLTAADLEMINAYLASNPSDVILSGDGRINDELRSAAGISEKGTTAVFEGTDQQKDYTLKQYAKEDSRFIRSRLPMKNAVRIGGSGLKHKKFRLVMTILLSLVAFALFGFADTAAGYDKITATWESIMDSNVKNASMTLGVRHTSHYEDGDSHTYHHEALLNDEDIEWLRNQTGMDFVPVYTGSRYRDGGFSISSMMKQYQDNTVYTGQMAGLVAMSEESLAKTGFAITGRLPAAKGEIAITELTYRQFNEYGFTNNAYDETVAAGALTMTEGDKNSILGKHITLSGHHSGGGKGEDGTDPNTFVIVGVIDTAFDYERYEPFLPEDKTSNVPQVEKEENALTEMVLMRELDSELRYGFHSLGFVTRESVDTLAASNHMMMQELGTSMHGWNKQMYVAIQPPSTSNDSNSSDGAVSGVVGGVVGGDKVVIGGQGIIIESVIGGASVAGDQINNVASSAALSKLKVTWLDGTPRTQLAPNEVVIPSSYVTSLVPETVNQTIDHDAFEQKVLATYPNGADVWNMADSFANYRDRLYQTAQVDYIHRTLATATDDMILELYTSFKTDDSMDSASLAEKKAFVMNAWTAEWMKEHSYHPMPNDISSREDVYRRADLFLLPLYLECFDLSLPEELTAEQQSIVERALLNDASNFFSNYSEEYPEYTVSSRDIVDILRLFESAHMVYGKALWQNSAFVEQMVDYQNGEFISRTAWGELNDDAKKEMAFGFYNSYYLLYSELGYESNDFGGKSGKELEAEAEDRHLEMAGIDFAALLSQMTFEHMETDHMTGNSTSKGKLPYTVVGYYDSNAYSYGSMLVCDSLMETYKAWQKAESEESGYYEDVAEHVDGQWSFVIAPMTTDADTLKKLVEMSYDETSDLKFELQNSVMNTLDTFNDFIESAATIFLYIGIGFAVFSALLLMNFIATSISYKKREIGVLRAVGARSSDVFKIFFSEALIIAAINFVLSVIAVIVAIFFTNNWVHNSGINVTLLSFGIRQVLLMILVSVGVALLASFLPVYNIARRKPIDAIRDK